MKYALTIFDSKYQDFGLLLMRVGLGLMFILFHGGPKMLAGPEGWKDVGLMAGLEFFPHFWGFMAAFAETVGAFFLLIGLFTRYALVLLVITMVMAVIFHLGGGDSVKEAAHPIEVGVFFLGLFFIGAGRYSLDAVFRQKVQ